MTNTIFDYIILIPCGILILCASVLLIVISIDVLRNKF